MLIPINDTTTVFQLQQQFSNYYPFLKIEFLKNDNGEKGKQNMVKAQPFETLGSIKKVQQPAFLEVMSWFTVNRLVHEFKSKLGLDVSVVKKEKDHWTPSNKTCFCTLKEQDEKARTTATFSPSIKKKKAIKTYDCL